MKMPTMIGDSQFDFKQHVDTMRGLVEEKLAQYLEPTEPDDLRRSMQYSVLAGGKRLRAMLCLSAARAVRDDDEVIEQALPTACAIEMVHAMSLIHDDLPCLDNDDLRRGKPTNHKVFGEAMALLAGDALLMLATEILIEETPKSIDLRTLLDVSLGLARATGWDGMVGGQVDDLKFTGAFSDSEIGQNKPNTETALTSRSPNQILESIHRRKTGALIRFSLWSGAAIAGGTNRQREALSRFGEILGLAFQIADDLLDVTGDATSLGKTPGKDQSSGKTTWVRLFGAEGSREKLRQLEQEGTALLNEVDLHLQHTEPLAALLRYAIHRSN